MSAPSLARSTPLAAVLLVAALLSSFVLPGAAAAQEAESGDTSMVVGTYAPDQVAQAAGIQAKLMEAMSGLQSRMETAQQEGDQEAMAQIRSEAQQIQQQITQDFIAGVDAVMVDVAESTGVAVIAVDVAYTGPGVTTKDVTDAVVEAMTAGTAEGTESE